MDRKQCFKEWNELVLSTCSKSCIPNANIVISLGFVNNKLLVADCQMKITIQNIKENPRICVISKYYRLEGNVDIYTSGEYFDICVKKNNDYIVKHALIININEVIDLDTGKKLL